MPVNSPSVMLVESGAVFTHGHTDSTAAATATLGEDLRTLVNTAGTVWITKPRLLGEEGAGGFMRGLGHGNELLRAGKRVTLKSTRIIDAAADTFKTMTGSFAVYGVNLPDALSCKPHSNAFAADPVETVKVFRVGTAIALSATGTFDASDLSTDAINADSKGYNWLVLHNGRILPWSNAKMTNVLSWSINAGVVTVYGSNAGGGTVAVGDEIVVYKLATADVTELLAAGIHANEDVTIQAKQVVWTYWTTNQLTLTNTRVRISPAVGA